MKRRLRRQIRGLQAFAGGASLALVMHKDRNKASVVNLFDANGKSRLVLKVEADGAASIEFLDAEGRVTSRLPK